jgi:glycosyltransferase involved in cell wall biosynthesis
MSGILTGFRDAGYRVALATTCPPPPQIEAAADDVAIARPGCRAERLVTEAAMVSWNRSLRRIGMDLSAHHQPAMVYQRHEYLLDAGLDVATERRAPLVLEWNASEAWARRNWTGDSLLGRHADAAVDRLVTRVERRVVAGSRLIAAVSAHAARMASEAGASHHQIVVSPNATSVGDIDRAGPAQRGPANEIGDRTVGWIGSFGPWHGAEVLVRALATLPRTVCAVMIGDGAEASACRRLADEIGVATRIEWAGTLAHDTALRRLKACDVLASPHVPLDGEPFFGSPTKVFEYMGLGRPIVASDLEQIGEVLQDGITARLVRPGDSDDLAKAIKEVLDRPDRGAHLAQAARAEVESHHTWACRSVQVLERLGLPAGETVGSFIAAGD